MTIEEFTNHIEALEHKVILGFDDFSFKVKVVTKNTGLLVIEEEMPYDDDVARNETRSRVCNLLLRRILSYGFSVLNRTNPSIPIHEIFSKGT